MYSQDIRLNEYELPRVLGSYKGKTSLPIMMDCCYRLPPKELVVKYRKRHLTHANYISYHSHKHFYGGDTDFDDPIEDMGVASADPSHSFISGNDTEGKSVRIDHASSRQIFILLTILYYLSLI